MASRRGNGEGTVYALRHRPGLYQGQLRMAMPGGDLKRVAVYGKSKKEVRAKMTEILRQARMGIADPEKRRKLGDYLDEWLESQVRTKKRTATYTQYSWVAQKFLKPSLGGLDLKEVTVPRLQRYLDQLHDEGNSAHRIRLVRMVLSAALTQAMREELVMRNVARLVQIPSYMPKEVKPWSIEEASFFLERTKGHRHHAAYVLLVKYGLRRGEVLGLRWEDVNLDAGVLSIRNQLARQADGTFGIAPVKTRAGARDLPIMPGIRQALMEQRELVRNEGGVYPDHGLVFVAPTGKPQDPDAFYKSFQRAARQVGLRKVRVHDLRHTAATMLKDLGVAPRDAQLILGHADIATTMQVYQHDSLESRQIALEKVDRAL